MMPAPTAPTPEAAQIESLIGAARRRSVTVLAVKQLALLASAFLCCAILVILLGTDVVPATAVYLTLLGIVLVWLWRIQQAAKSGAAIAQILDHKLLLNDTISTAYFLQHHPAEQDGPWRFIPLKQAAEIAPTVEPRRAFPFEGQRWWAIAGILALVAVGCFITRYLVIQTLSLHPPFVTLSLPPILDRIEEAFGTKETDPLKPLRPDSRNKAALNANGEQQENNSSQKPENQVPPPLQAKAQTSSSGEPGSQNEDGKPEIGDQQTAGAASGESSAQSNPQDTSQRGAANTSQPDTAENSGESARNSESPSKRGAAGPPSLMSRMKDTLSSMMAKLNPQSGGQQSPSAGDPSQKGGQQGEEAAKAGEQSASQQGNSGEDKANAKESSGGQGDGQTAEKPGGRQGNSSSDSQQKGSDSQSGVGKQDGDKQLRDAGQQQAMGKLAEVLGKRSANLTGDMSVETPSGNQQLKTEYSNRQGSHVGSTGEINRNEVPARYRDYLREYMEQVRKTPGKK